MTQADLWLLVAWGLLLGAVGGLLVWALVEKAWNAAGVLIALVAIITWGTIRYVRTTEGWVR